MSRKPIQILGKYELTEKIGAGGMAEVYKARLKGIEGFQKVVVVKKILPAYARNVSFIRMLVEEAKLTSVLQHPNIVQIFELGSHDNQFYIVMEFVEGKDLLKILARSAEMKTRPPLEIICHIVSEVCKGLDYAHKATDINGRLLNIIHRDISPSNIIISRDGHVKIMDFGVAKAKTQDSGGSRHVLRGKLGYMSPEQVRAEDIDNRSDLFSLGVVFFESLTLKRLFLGRTDLETLINIRDANIEKKLAKYPFLDPGLSEILRRALSKDRDTRYNSGIELHNDIEDYLYKNGYRVNPQNLSSFLGGIFELEDRQLLSEAETDEETSSGEGEDSVQEQLEDDPLLIQVPGKTSFQEEKTSVHKPGQSDPEVEIRTDMPQSQVIAPPGQAANTPSGFAGEPSRTIGREFTAEMELQGHNFRFRNTSGYVFGPVNFANMVNMVQIGAIAEDESVSIDGGEWRKVKEITTVRSISPNESLRRKGITPIYSGALVRLVLPKILSQLASRRLSGKLRFYRGSAQKEFYFRKGKVVHIASNLKQELVGSFLLRRGAVTADQMNAALKRINEFGGRIGDTLVSLGLIRPHELFNLLDQQFREKFLQLFLWTSGNYEFYEGIPAPVEMAPANVTVYQFILEGMRKHATDPELQAFIRPFRSATMKRNEGSNPYLRIDDLPLKPIETRILSQIKRSKNVKELELTYRNNQEQMRICMLLLVVLHQCDLLQFAV